MAGGVEIAVAVFLEAEDGTLTLRREIPGIAIPGDQGWEPQIPDRLLPGEVYFVREGTCFTPLIGIRALGASGYDTDLLAYAADEDYP